MMIVNIKIDIYTINLGINLFVAKNLIITFFKYLQLLLKHQCQYTTVEY